MVAIESIEQLTFTYTVDDVGTDQHGFNSVHEPGSERVYEATALRVHTTAGATGEYVGGTSVAHAQVATVAPYLVGKNPLRRERHWNELKRQLRKYDQMGIAPLDIALWDFAGKYHDAPIHELLGTYRTSLPTYVSTYFAGDDGRLDSPEGFAEFAAECRDHGFPAFKMHTWAGQDEIDVDREVTTVERVGERVGDDMDLMLDPCCEYHTFGQALTVGRACDEYDYFWYEDPYRDGGRSQHGNATLRDRLDTPLLITEHLRGVEPTTDFIANGGTDFVRADPAEDLGITGAMKIAKIAEGFGLDVEFHLPGPARRHCMAATRNSNYYELGTVHPGHLAPATPPIYAGDYEDSFDAIDDRGRVSVPTNPGLGVDYRWDFVEDNLVDRVVYE